MASPLELVVHNKDDIILVNIFNFLGSPHHHHDGVLDSSTADVDDEEGAKPSPALLFVRDAARLHVQLSSVCRAWRTLCNNKLPQILGPLNADFNALWAYNPMPCIRWLSKYQLILGSLKFDPDHATIPLVEHILKTCRTDQLRTVRAQINNAPGSFGSEWIAATAARLDGNLGCVDLTTDEPVSSVLMSNMEEMTSALGIPSGYGTQEDLHDTIAAECPSVTDLSLRVWISLSPNNEWMNPSANSDLFSMHSVQRLHLSLGLDCPDEARMNDGMMIANIIRNLASLRELSVACRNTQVLSNRKFQVDSPMLRSLDVTGLGKHVFISCNCPRLENFSCRGSHWGNGSAPNVSTAELESLINSSGADDVRVEVVSIESNSIGNVDDGEVESNSSDDVDDEDIDEENEVDDEDVDEEDEVDDEDADEEDDMDDWDIPAKDPEKVLIARAGSLPFIGMDVPGSCVFRVEEFYLPAQDHLRRHRLAAEDEEDDD